MNVAEPSPLSRAPLEPMPRECNFAADILKRNLDAGRAGKLAFIDHRQGWSYGDLAERVERCYRGGTGARVPRGEARANAAHDRNTTA